jgi:hypothetical protein
MIIGDEIMTQINLSEAKLLVERRKAEYNTARPHSPLNYRPPAPESSKPEWLENAIALLKAGTTYREGHDFNKQRFKNKYS